MALENEENEFHIHFARGVFENMEDHEQHIKNTEEYLSSKGYSYSIEKIYDYKIQGKTLEGKTFEREYGYRE